MMEIIDTKISDYVHRHTKPESELLGDLIKKTNNDLEYSDMLSGRVEGRFLAMLVKLTGAKRILEIGMFTGFSALTMAEALPEDGKIITCDVNERYAEIARDYFNQSPHGYKIDVRIGNALETIKSFTGPFDLVFIDADKENYPEYYNLVMPLIPSGGLIVIDNALLKGGVLDPKDHRETAINNLNKFILEDESVENVILTVRDGINLVRKI